MIFSSIPRGIGKNTFIFLLSASASMSFYDLKIEFIMEDCLQKASNEHRTLYYSSQLKVMDISQNIRAMGTKFTNNEIKTITLETFNHFCMLEKIFQEAQLTHLYQLIKTINLNYNSVITVLLERENKLIQIIGSKTGNNQKQEQVSASKVEEVLPGQTNLMREIKKNRLGGIHLFNQNYARYLEDHRIMDQIKLEKSKRLHRNRLEILRESIFEELNHKTDVEEFPAKNDEITNYILKSKDKNSVFNYVSYEPELQEILTFFQNSQSEANNFLVRKTGKISQEDGSFSFSDFQRDIQMKNYNFKRQIIEKFKQFIQKYRKKQEQIERYVSEREAFFKRLEQKYFKMQEQSCQTDLNLDEYLKTHEQKVKQIELKCQALENMKKQEINNNEKEGQLIHELAIRQNHIQKLNYKLAEQQAAIEYVKKLLRQQKTKKSFSVREEPPKSQKTIQQNTQKEKEKSVQAKQGSQAVENTNEEILNLNSTSQLRKSSYMSNSWRRKQSNDGISYMSFNDLDKESKDHDGMSKTQKKKYVRYHVDNKYSEPDKNQSYLIKPRNTQSTENYVQTEHDHRAEYLQQSHLRETYERLEVLPEQQQYEKKSSKKNKLTPSSTPKTSAKNVDFNLSKNSNEKLTETSKRLKQRNNITSLTKIKSQQDLYQSQSQALRVSKQNKPKKSARKEQKKVVKQQNHAKKEDMKLDRLNFNKEPTQAVKNDHHQQQSATLLQSQSVDSILKVGDKRDQTAYKIFEVVEEQDEQKETIKNTERSQKMSSVYSHKKLEFQLMDKLNRELNRIKIEKHCTFQHLYDLIILPHQKHRQTNSGIDMKATHASDWKMDRTSIEISDPSTLQAGITKITDNKEIHNNILKVKSKDQAKPLASFDELIKCAGPENQIKKQKLKNWKKKMMNHLKSQVISQQEAQQIVSVIRQSTKQNEVGFRCESVASPISSIANNIRNSLPEIDDIFEGKSMKKGTGCLRKAKLKTSCQETQESNAKIDKFQDKLAPEIQQKIEDLIHFEALQPNFKEKFALLHKKCQEGAICSHINKYFESIMKHYQQTRKKGKQTLVLPIEHIGKRTDAQQITEKENKQSPRKIENKDHLVQKQVSLSKGKNFGLTRQRLSQDLLLPNIKDFKVSHFKTTKVVI